MQTFQAWDFLRLFLILTEDNKKVRLSSHGICWYGHRAQWSKIQNFVLKLSYFRDFFLKFLYFEKATKFCKISTLLLSYVVPVKIKVEILQNFVAFSEYMNFNLYFLHQTLYKIARKEGIELAQPFNAVTTSWSQNDLNQALSAIKNGVPVQKAAAQYKIPTGKNL